MSSEKIVGKKDKEMIFRNHKDMIQMRCHLLQEIRRVNMNPLLAQMMIMAVQIQTIQTNKIKWLKKSDTK